MDFRNYDLCSPIYFYILNEPKIVDLTKQRLWTIILENESSDHVLDLLKWMQVHIMTPIVLLLFPQPFYFRFRTQKIYLKQASS